MDPQKKLSIDQRHRMLIYYAKQLDYWTPRKDTSLEGQEQHEYATNMIKFIVTQYETDPMRSTWSYFNCLGG